MVKNHGCISRSSLKDTELANGIGPDPTALSKLHVQGGMCKLKGHGGKHWGLKGWNVGIWGAERWNAGSEGVEC